MNVLVAVTQLVPDEALDTDDSPEIAGSHIVEVRDGSSDPTEEALDTFHKTIGIACLDDCSISASTIDPAAIPADATWI
ncbi:hypothetical protein [Microvirga sp. VF16]|uniref:hypothetical protein n=1 Tax=Microvirga sp. VF16 TaxID=2807101 RepID=UPI00193CE7F6|nr:hypothetical protein [Microvirga sp. VF16]QRM34778.1 hypothetical protein JO965_41685 [Microvirga sp. VF16]